jgi:cytochrome c biogenesis protein CcmG, thiol:disulfide interchange protein DsbE
MSVRTAIRSATGVVVVVLAGVLVWHLTHQPKSVLGAVAKHKIVPAPNFTLDRLNGSGKLTFASLRGKVVVVNFWASWCGPCKEEMPRLVSFAHRWSGRQVVVVGIDIGETHKGPGQSFSRHYGATYPMVVDPDTSTAGPWGILGTPQTFFVDRRGRIVDYVAGPVSNAELSSGIRTALKT